MKVGVMPGDGIGIEVIPVALEVLEAAGFRAEYVHLDVGLERWKRDGRGIGPDTFEALEGCRCALLGAVQSPLDPNYRSVVVELRRHFDLYACLRPVRLREVDLTVVRENTEGLYSGIEQVGGERSTTLRVVTRAASERIARFACAQAKARGLPLTVVHKANVLKSDLLFREACLRMAAQEGVEVREKLLDAAAYDLALRPRVARVMVSTNLFGDVLSDLCAGLVGSLGLCPSANIGEGYAIFEPVHGSAPDIAGLGVANPMGAVLSAAMMLEWLGEAASAERVRQSVEAVLGSGPLTPDLGGKAGTQDVTAAIVERLHGG